MLPALASHDGHATCGNRRSTPTITGWADRPTVEAGGDLVVVVLRADGRRNDKAAGYGAMHAFNARNGKITRFREYVDIDEAIG